MTSFTLTAASPTCQPLQQARATTAPQLDRADRPGGRGPAAAPPDGAGALPRRPRGVSVLLSLDPWRATPRLVAGAACAAGGVATRTAPSRREDDMRVPSDAEPKCPQVTPDG